MLHNDRAYVFYGYLGTLLTKHMWSYNKGIPLGYNMMREAPSNRSKTNSMSYISQAHNYHTPRIG